MIEYYKLSFVREEKGKSGVPEEFILEISENGPSVLAYLSEKPRVRLATAGIEKITDGVIKKIILSLCNKE